MSLLTYKTLAGILIFITSLLAVIYPLKMRAAPRHHLPLELGDAFASGIFLGAALFHMLPDAISGFNSIYGNLNFPLAELICAAGFLILLFFERLSGLAHAAKSKLTVPYMIVAIIIVHSLIEGAVLGVNSTLATASIIFLAIIAHKGSESFSLAVILNRSSLSMRHLIILIGIFSVMTPLGIALGALVIGDSNLHSNSLVFAAGFDAFAAGTFLFMSTLHHINHHHRSHGEESLLEFFFIVLGLGLMAVLAIWS